MRLRSRLVLTVKHHLGQHPVCPHPPYRVHLRPPRMLERAGHRFRCHECWRSWTVPTLLPSADYSWMDA